MLGGPERPSSVPVKQRGFYELAAGAGNCNGLGRSRPRGSEIDKKTPETVRER